MNFKTLHTAPEKLYYLNQIMLYIAIHQFVNLLFYCPVFSDGKKSGKSNRLNIKTIRFHQKKWKDNLVLHYLISKWIFFLITFRRHQDLHSFPQNCWFYKQRNFFKMMLEFRKDWKDLAFVGRYNLLNGRFLHHLWTKVSQLNVSLLMSAPQFFSKMLKNLKEQGFCRKV